MKQISSLSPLTQKILSISCTCKNDSYTIPQESELIQCPLCQMYQHSKCLHQFILLLPKYMCMKCLFTSCDPFITTIQSFIQPSYLKESSSFSFKASLPSEHFIILRCLLLKDGAYTQFWPPYCTIYMNSKLILKLDINTRGLNEPFIFVPDKLYLNDIPYKKNVFSVKNILYLNNNVDNKLDIKIDNFCIKKGEVYIINCDLVIKRIDKKDIMKDIQRINIKANLSKLIGSEEVFEDQIDVIDCYSLSEMIKKPCRGYLCRHLAVFDLDKYLDYSKNLAKKVCPICNRLPGKLYIDGVILQKLDEDQRKIEKYVVSSDYKTIVPYESTLENAEQTEIVIDLELAEDEGIYFNNKEKDTKDETDKSSLHSSDKEVIALMNRNAILKAYGLERKKKVKKNWRKEPSKQMRYKALIDKNLGKSG